jgi:glycosyltransferase involved in cell wall biosynthesis
VFYLNIRKVRQWLGLRRQLHEVPFGLLYTNSLWNPFFTVIPIVAARLGLIRVKKILIAPRGELSPGALSLKARKKRLFLKWWGPFLRRMDVIWHASTEREASEIRAVCPWASTEISLDQFSLPAEPVAPKAHSGVPRLVFIGRVSPKKNLSLTLKALGNVSGAVEFDIYGPLEDTGYWSKCQSLIARLPHTVRVRYRGELLHADVPRTFSHYDAFVFPTLGENFGHVIAESLSVSCPVVCSDETPWSPVLESGGGIVVRDLTAQALAGDLQRIAAMTPEERLQARYRAGDAYRVWHGTVDRNNILDKVRLSPRSSPR